MPETPCHRRRLHQMLIVPLLVLILTIDKVCLADNSTSASELASSIANSTSTPLVDSRLLVMEPRSGHIKDDDNVDSSSSLQNLGPGGTTKPGSELALNLGATFKQRKKSDEQQSQQKSSSSPRPISNVFGPIISPRYKMRGAAQQSRPVVVQQQAGNGRDSYLDALEQSHAIRQQQQLGRREYTPGPVYRGPEYYRREEQQEKQQHDSSPSSSNFIETEVKASKISQASIVDIVPSKSWSTSSGDAAVYSHKQQLPHFNSYHSFDPDAEYQQTPHKYPSSSSPPHLLSQSSYKPSHQSSYKPAAASPSISFSPVPEISYETPQISYGSPQISYGSPPASSYGPPHVAYGHPQGSYGTPQGLGTLSASYSTSYPLPDLFPLTIFPIDLTWPISLKLNAYTLIKIVLKIIIFKMIVKFIGTICLLLFIPKLIHKKDDHEDDDESRKFIENGFSEEQLLPVTSIVMDSIKHYEDLNKNETRDVKPCTGLGCQIVRDLFPSQDTWNDYIRLFKNYAAEEQAIAEQNPSERTRQR